MSSKIYVIIHSESIVHWSIKTKEMTKHSLDGYRSLAKTTSSGGYICYIQSTDGKENKSRVLEHIRDELSGSGIQSVSNKNDDLKFILRGNYAIDTVISSVRTVIGSNGPYRVVDYRRKLRKYNHIRNGILFDMPKYIEDFRNEIADEILRSLNGEFSDQKDAKDDDKYGGGDNDSKDDNDDDQGNDGKDDGKDEQDNDQGNDDSKDDGKDEQDNDQENDGDAKIIVVSDSDTEDEKNGRKKSKYHTDENSEDEDYQYSDQDSDEDSDEDSEDNIEEFSEDEDREKTKKSSSFLRYKVENPRARQNIKKDIFTRQNQRDSWGEKRKSYINEKRRK